MTVPLDDNQEARVEDAVCRFVEMRALGEQPDLHEFANQYPGLEREIIESIQASQKIDSLFDSVVQADAGDFEVAAASDLVGQTIGSFEVVEIVGRGGMGVVYLARDTRLERFVAIKSVPAEMAGDATARARFRREARLLASLNHANVAVIYEIVEHDDGAAYLVLEYVPGETLAERIAREPLTLEQALSVGRQVAEAVSAAHKNGVVHRDLKPGNIKITPEDKVKVLDFGLAKTSAREDRAGDISTTQPGHVVGTPAYMSPEQARGKETDHRTDIWSFGCVMFQMLTGRLPFEGETATDTLARIIEREPEWELLPRTTPTNIRDLLRRCLEKDPDRRLGDIADAATEISNALKLPVAAKPPTLLARLRASAVIITATLVVALSGIAVWSTLTRQASPSTPVIRLAVLPFENLGPPEDEYFADGFTDAITARLAGIQGLGVISRQSAMQYKDSDKSIQQIARELSVEYILEGTVQREQPSNPNSRVRIVPQLIRASDDTHMWAEPYDNDLSAIFQVQADIAERIANALDIPLSERERRALQSAPTEDFEAYDYYLQGKKYFDRAKLPVDHKRTIRMCEKAVELDPNLAPAYALLSRSHVSMYWMHWDRSEERLMRAERAARKALRLDPELPEGHLALGQYYYHGELNYARALQQLDTALKSRPNDGDIFFLMGCIQRRQGKFEQAVTTLKRACELDPRYGVFASNLAETLTLMRRYVEAERTYDSFLSSLPDRRPPYHFKAWLRVYADGDTARARAILDEAFENGELPFEDNIANLLAEIDVFDRNYEDALRRRIAARGQAWNTQHQYIPKALRCALICMHMKDEESAKKYFDDARVLLEGKVEETWEDARFHSSLGIAYAGLGRQQEAVKEGELATDLLPVSRDAMRGPYREMDLAQIYTMVGDHERATDRLDYLLSIPSQVSKVLLRLDPTWDPLRDHPRFQRLLEANN